MGILESTGLMPREDLDRFMNTILRSRISRRVIAEQHLALTETFNAPWFSPGAKLSESEFIGEVFIKCVAADVVNRCGRAVQALARSTFGAGTPVPDIRLDGHLDASFPYILSHLEYIVGELLRNSVQAVVERHQREHGKQASNSTRGAPLNAPDPIVVTICEAPQHVVVRISDRGGGVPRDELPHLWSFSKGAQSQRRLENLGQVPKMAATMQELHVHDELGRADLKTPSYRHDHDKHDRHDKHDKHGGHARHHEHHEKHDKHDEHGEHGEHDKHGRDSSLSTLSSRPPNLRLGMGLPLSRVYAEYWAGSLELHSLEGYGVDAFLQISKLGNKNEQLTTRASMDAV
jgi:hypothetical protein